MTKKIEWLIKLNGKYLPESGGEWTTDPQHAATFGRDIDAMVRLSGIAAQMSRNESDFDITYRYAAASLRRKTETPGWIASDGQKYRGTPAQVRKMIAADHGISAPVGRVKYLAEGRIEVLGVILTPLTPE